MSGSSAGNQAPVSPDLAARVVAAREARGWSQEQLAEAAGVTRATVARVEAAKPGQPARTRRVVDALGLGDAVQVAPSLPSDVQLVQALIAEVLLGQDEQARRELSVALVAHLISLREGRT